MSEMSESSYSSELFGEMTTGSMELPEKEKPLRKKPKAVKGNSVQTYSEEIIYKLHYPSAERDLSVEYMRRINQQKKAMRRLDDEKIRKALAACDKIQQRYLSSRLKFQCHYKQRIQKAEIQRKQVKNRLKNLYKIDVEHLEKNVADDIIVGIQQMEKKIKIREKRKMENVTAVIARLLEEQKRKRKVLKTETEPKKIKSEIDGGSCFEVPEEIIWAGELDVEEPGLFSEEQSGKSFCSKKISLTDDEIVVKEDVIVKQSEILTKEDSEKMKDKSGVMFDPVCSSVSKQKILGENLMATDFINNLEDASVLAQKKIKVMKAALLVTAEKSLKATPQSVVFKNFDTEKSYDQELKITNIGTKSLQCYFLNAEYEEVYEDATPLRVMILNRPLLRPGLSFTVTITLYTTILTEIKGTLLFQTKKKNSKENKTYFRVPFICTPASAVVSVTPTKIIFPALPWCCATGPKKSKKVLRIKNLGGKKCAFKIVESTTESCWQTESEEESLKDRENLKEEENFEEQENLIHENILRKEENSLKAVNGSLPEVIIEELLDNVFSAFRFSKKYYIELKPYSTKVIYVLFSPQYKGLHCNLYNLQFENCSNCSEQSILVSGDIERMPLRVEPAVIDLKTCVMDSGVYQGVFKVYNESSKTFPVIAKIPKCLKNFCHIFPNEPVVQSLGFCIFSLKFYPSYWLTQEAQAYYSQETQLFEFPIYIRPNTSYACKSKSTCKPDFLKIYVIALVTDHTLELNPAQIDFGSVTTLETVRKEISLTNHSLSVQEYGFLNLPKGVRVEPNMGFGKIFPKETVSLFVMYSPVLENIEGNDAGLQGTEGRHNFEISVTSIAELGSSQMVSEESTDQASFDRETVFLGEEDGIEEPMEGDEKSLLKKHEEQLIQIKETIELVPEKIKEDLEVKIQEKEQKIREFLKKGAESSKCSFSNQILLSDQAVPQRETESNPKKKVQLENQEAAAEIKPSEKINSIRCSAFVTDPYCELSSTVIQLPVTPCSSFSLTKFRIVGENFSTSSKCYCGFISKTQRNISSKSLQFEFRCDFPQIKIEPLSGYFEIGQDVPICIIFTPENPANVVQEESKRQKSAEILAQINEENIEENKEGEISAISVTKPVKRKKGKEKKKHELSNPKVETVEDMANSSSCRLKEADSFEAEKNLFQTMEPFHSEIKISCIIKSGDKTRSESHEMIIISPAIKPDFAYLGNSREIAFGKVPIGTKSTLLIKFQNIVIKKIYPALSILNPFGPFYYPNGKIELDPEHVWSVPITFTPSEEKKYVELFGIRSGKTILLMKTTGEGIEAKLSTNPNLAVVRMEAKPGGFSEFKFDLENSNDANMSLKLVKEFTKASAERRPSVSDKNKKKLQIIEIEITEEILQEVETFYNEEVENECLIFTLSELKEEGEILVSPFAKVTVKIQFTPPPGEENKSYVTKYMIVLGKWKILKEFLIFGTITKRK